MKHTLLTTCATAFMQSILFCLSYIQPPTNRVWCLPTFIVGLTTSKIFNSNKIPPLHCLAKSRVDNQINVKIAFKITHAQLHRVLIVQQLYQGTFHPPQDPPRLVPKCAPGCQFWYFRCSQENNIGEIWVSGDFCTTAWWKMEHFWNGG